MDWKKKGNALLAEGRLDDAIACYEKAVQQNPGDAYAHLNLGFGLNEQGKLERAAESLRNCLLVNPALFDAHYLLARVLEQLGQANDALHAYRRALIEKPDFREALAHLLQLLVQQLQFSEALTWADRWIAVEATTQAAHVFRARALHGLQRFDEALQALDRIPAQGANDAQTWHARGNILFALERYEEALVAYEAVLAHEPDFVEALTNCGATLLRLLRTDQAIDIFRRALALKSDDIGTLYNLGFALMTDGDCRGSLAVTVQGLAIHPDDANLHWNKAIAHLLLGELDQGWADFEWRWKAPVLGERLQKLRFPQPLWTGQQALAGKTILMTHEQGLGDNIQFVRYAALLRAQGAARVYVEVPKSLRAFLDGSGDVCHFVTEGDPLPQFDFYCPMMSLPMAFGTTLATIPAQVPSLRSDANLRQHWEDRLGPRSGPRVGLVWSGNAKHQNDHNRSIPLAALLEHAPSHCPFVSLQQEVRTRDRPTLAQHPGLLHFGPELHGFAETAALVDCMDLVISVDTSVAHLAGALGRPLWLLLPRQVDWRWMLDRDDSPWYPTARLFRQARDQRWAPVLQRVMTELQSFQPTPP